MVSSISNNDEIRIGSLPLEIFSIHLMEENNLESIKGKHLQKVFEIIWIQEGSGTHTINQTEFHLTSNKVYCAIPGQKHQLTIDPGAKGYIVSFTESFLNTHYNEYSPLHVENFFHRLLHHPELGIENETSEDMEEVLLLLLKETKNNFSLMTEIVNKYLKIFLLYLRRQLKTDSSTNPATDNCPLLKQFRLLLENNFKEKKAVSQYAKALFVTPNHLNRVLKATTGFSARHHIQQRIVMEAKSKALHTRTSMKEIAYYLGFDDIAHFSKFFKNTSGTNFTSFKKLNTESFLTMHKNIE